EKWKKGKEEDAQEIPMAAMPDIAFLLLIFFMVSTTFMITRKMNVELPSYEGETSDEETMRMNVHLTPESVRAEYGDETREFDLLSLERYVQGALQSTDDQNEQVVLLDVSDNCQYQRVIDAFDAIRAGGGYVSLVENEE
ncbi:MAG: ExbD/TolR family protein, partial [Planctomycetota bacterium]